MTWGKRRAIIIFVLVAFFVLIICAASRSGGGARIASNSVLVVDTEGAIEEQRLVDFSALTRERIPVLHDYLDAIENRPHRLPHHRACGTDCSPATGWGKLEEIRAHLINFRKSGKPNICYLGGDGIGNAEDYLASACEKDAGLCLPHRQHSRHDGRSAVSARLARQTENRPRVLSRSPSTRPRRTCSPRRNQRPAPQNRGASP